MAGRHPPRVVKESDVQEQLASLLDDVTRNNVRVLIESGGSPAAAIVSIDDVQRFDEAECAREEQFGALSRSWDAFQDVSPNGVEAAVFEAIAAVRVQQRRENDSSDTSA